MEKPVVIHNIAGFGAGRRDMGILLQRTPAVSRGDGVR